MLRNWSAPSKVILKGFWSIFEAILVPKMEAKSKKNGIKNKCDFMTKLEGRMARSEGETWPVGASHMRARSFRKTKNPGSRI